MNYPQFFDQVEPIVLYDPLARFLGAFDDGRIEIRYLDVVRLAGHSCPTVAGAFLMAAHGLKALYGNEAPIRGEIEVEMQQHLGEGVCGVIANILSFITGATEESGFHGIGGRFDRRNLLSFGNEIASPVRFTRRDTGEKAAVRYDPSFIPSDPNMAPLLSKSILGHATEEEGLLFRRLWQERVENILTHNAEDPRLVVVE
jgi:hypothetical protein